jgi:putative ABC transport system permease protein
MEMGDALRNAFANLAGHKLRSGLTMLGMVFGVAAVIAMLSIGAGAERQALEMIDRLGAHNILVRDVDLTEDRLSEIRKNSPGVSPRDAEAIADAVPGIVETSMRVKIDPYSVFSGNFKTEAIVHGVGANHAELTNIQILDGRFIDDLDIARHAQICVIGAGVRRDLFGFEPSLGKLLKVNDLWLEVVGVLEGTGPETTVQGVALGSTDGEIYIPVTTAIRKFEHPLLEAPLDEIIVRLEGETIPGEAAAMISGLLGRLHGGEDDFEIIVPDALLEQSRQTQRMFSIVMGCIAGISLLVGGIGIMNIMLATVFERTREIGIRRAVGARPRDIRTLFLMESFAISVVGGIAGILVGVAIARIVALSAGWPTVVTPWSVLVSSSVSIGVGLISGLYPAIRAAELNPIDALRWE